jgi:predicted enzyme related to lactoylglutathione lyase
MAIKSYDLAWISVSDMQKARNFFVDTLGMKVMDDQPNYGWLEVAGEKGARIGIGIGAPESPLKAGNNAVISLSVDNLDATKKMLVSKNVTILGDIMEVPGQVRLLLIQDQDGNLIHLCESLRTE